MKISMYQASIPVFIRMLKNLRAILQKGQAYAEAKKIEPTVLINSRLYPDMFPLVRQIQIASDVAKGCGARLAGLEPPKFDDNESTFPELFARIDETIAYLGTLKPDQIDGTEEKTITMQIRNNTLTFAGMPFLLNFATPNFYFHVTTAYDIFRHCGVEIGKQDFIGTM